MDFYLLINQQDDMAKLSTKLMDMVRIPDPRALADRPLGAQSVKNPARRVSEILCTFSFSQFFAHQSKHNFWMKIMSKMSNIDP